MGLTEAFPLPFIFTAGGRFEPATPLAAELCARHYAAGAKYLLVEHQERSLLSHNQQFAWIDEAWRQLPEKLADLYPTPEHLRKRALIEAGFYHEEAIDCGTKAAALRVAAYLRKHDDFAHLILRGPTLLVRTAKSQSYRAMDREEFQASKSAILEIVAAMIEVAPETLKLEAGKAA